MRSTPSIIALAAALLLAAACDTAPSDDDAAPVTPGPWEVAFDTAETGWLLSVSGTAPDDLWAVGGTPDAGRILHTEGAGWTPVPLDAGQGLVNWAHAFARDDVMFAGAGGAVLRWDGAKLAKMPTPTDQDLWGIWGATPDDVWAVGGAGKKEGDRTVLHWDGATWKAADVPPLTRPKVSAFYKVWGSAADDVYIVGRNGAVLHWDGKALTELGVGASQDLIAVWGTSADHVVIVGGRSSGVIARWDGATWRTEQIGTLPGINGVWMRSPERFHIAANQGTLASVDFDTLAVTDEALDTEVDFHGMFGMAGHLYAVGGNFLYAGGPWLGDARVRRLGDDE